MRGDLNVIELILIELCNSINFQFNPVEICMVIFDPNQLELNRTHNKIALRIDYISIKSKLLFSIFSKLVQIEMHISICLLWIQIEVIILIFLS